MAHIRNYERIISGRSNKTWYDTAEKSGARITKVHFLRNLLNVLYRLQIKWDYNKNVIAST
jgi:hypothetical protein